MVALSSIAIVPATARAAAPVVLIDAPATAVTGAPVAFDGEGTTDPDGQLMDYTWSIDGQALDVESPWLSVAFAHPGHHVVALTATDSGGASATAQRGIDVTGQDRSPSSLKPFGTSLAPGVAAAPEVVVHAPKVRLRKHRLRVELRCRGAARCKGTLRAVALKGRHQTPFLLAQRSFDIASGGPRVIHVRLSRRARQRLGRRTAVRATAFRGRVRTSSIWGTMSYRVPVAR
ncbi:hypothetical protein DSM104299_01469 [Baekduia alba]|uniref:PKD domain-containing protein n=1 Tax=Baekduia alba TaxID=2997333 RepID=UPI00234247E5|nr:PKD domain-containing protein [Baekduia alba]WCB92770.1 hypothetical protein DSM104299_01469 [Baekduia alba]